MDLLSEIKLIEQNLPGIKRDVDQFQEVLKRAEAGHYDGSLLSQKYHALFSSSRSLSNYMNTLKKSNSNVTTDPTLPYRIKSLHGQIYSLLERLKSFGERTRKIANNSSITNIGLNFGSQSYMEKPIDIDDGAAHQMTQKKIVTQDEDEITAREMRQLEHDIGQVSELFATMANYVQDQGELVDSIEAHIEDAYDQVTSGSNQLRSAVRYKNSARKKKFIFLGVFITILTIIGIIIGVYIKNNSGS